MRHRITYKTAGPKYFMYRGKLGGQISGMGDRGSSGQHVGRSEKEQTQALAYRVVSCRVRVSRKDKQKYERVKIKERSHYYRKRIDLFGHVFISLLCVCVLVEYDCFLYGSICCSLSTYLFCLSILRACMDFIYLSSTTYASVLSGALQLICHWNSPKKQYQMHR